MGVCPDSLASSIYVIFELTGLKSSAQIWDMKHVPSDIAPSAQWTHLGTSMNQFILPFTPGMGVLNSCEIRKFPQQVSLH